MKRDRAEIDEERERAEIDKEREGRKCKEKKASLEEVKTRLE